MIPHFFSVKSKTDMRCTLLLMLALLALMPTCHATEDSCVERCENGFDATKQCQCDSMCKYYQSCCADYESVCLIITRGDTFPVFPEDEMNSTEVLSTPKQEISSQMFLPTTRTKLHSLFIMAPPNPDPDAEVCSGRSFDSFLQLKNGSVYAFRGMYFFELDEKSVLPGYPKRIEDVWGIKGPIDAAFTRINCQGKTYIFKGNQYWRFDNGVLDEDYPRNISVGFENIPDDLNAAFAIPAHNYHGKEKVYFFKGDQYYQYEFKHQPSHEECFQMSRSSPSALFNRYTDIYYNRWKEHFRQLFGGFQNHLGKHQLISKDWIGIKSPVDAVLAGRLYVTPRHLQRPSRRRQDRLQKYNQQWNQQWERQWDRQWDQQWNQQWNQQGNHQWDQQQSQQWDQQRRGQRSRQNRSPFWDAMADKGISIGREFSQRFGQDHWSEQERRRTDYQRQQDYDYEYRFNPFEHETFDTVHRPLQSVYFFKGDQYYRVNLQTKHVDHAVPPYPRSIGKYWLGCSDKPGPEKR